MRSSARVNPYSGSSQMTSKSADPTESYRYLEGNSFCPALPSPSQTSDANGLTRAVCITCVCMGPPYLFRVIPIRNGILHRHIDNVAGTSCGKTAAANTPRYAPSHL